MVNLVLVDVEATVELVDDGVEDLVVVFPVVVEEVDDVVEVDVEVDA